MEWIILECSLCLIEEAMIFLFMNSLLKSRFNTCIPLIIAIILSSAVVYYYSSYDIMLKVLFDIIRNLFFSIILFKDNFVVKASYSFLSIYILYVPEMIFGNIFSVMLEQGFFAVFYSVFIQKLAVYLFMKLFNAVTFYVIFKIMKKVNHDMRDKSWRIFGLTILAFLLVSASCLCIYIDNIGNLYYYTGNVYLDIIYMIIAVSFFIMSLVVIHFFAKVNIGLQRDSKLFLLESNFNSLQEQIAFQKQNINEFHKLRHDMKNHIANAKALIEKGSIEEAVLLLGETGNAYKNVTLMDFDSGNNFVNAILLSKFALAESKNISVNYSLESISNIQIEPIDISSLLSNLLDNAIEASEKADEPIINLCVFKKNAYYVINVENSICENSHLTNGNYVPVSTKPNSALHGYGMQIIDDIAQKYDGNFSWKVKNKKFIATVLLKL